MPDDTFLVQLEQRTEQVKITLANLEAERARIENMIAQIQPIVPHYDALVAAERALREANVSLDTRGEPAGSEPAGNQPGEATPQAGGYDAGAAEREADATEQAPTEGGIPPEHQGDLPPADPPPHQPWNS